MQTKTKKISALTLFLATILATNTAFGAYTPINTNVCTLMVNPFNPLVSAKTGNNTPQNTLDSLINFLSNSTCSSHLTYGNPYSPQPPAAQDNPVVQGAESENIPITRHDHSYINPTTSELYTSPAQPQNQSFYYKSFVEKFQIILKQDAYNNIDPNQIWCDTPIPSNYSGTGINNLSNCNGIANDLYGGTKVTKTVDSVNKNITITWNFAYNKDANGNYSGRPYVWGDNGPNFVTYDSNNQPLPAINTTPISARELPFHVHLGTKDNGSIWSATTNSKVLLADYAIRVDNFQKNSTKGCVNNNVNDPSSGWCYINPDPQYQTENVQLTPTLSHNYYWYNIGNVATVWKKYVPPVTPDCLSLGVSPTGPLLETDLPKTINISSQTQGGLNLNYKWTADQNNVLNFGAAKYAGNPIYASNPLLAISEAAKLTSPVTVTVTGVDASKNSTEFAAKCQQKIVINPVTPPTPPDCSSLSVNPAGPFNDTDLPKTISVSSQTQGGLQVDYKWDADTNAINNLLIGGLSYSGQAFYNNNPQILNLSKQISAPITVTISAVDKSHEITYPKCVQKILINATPRTCDSLDISPAGPLTEAAMANGQAFKVTPHVTGNQQLDYKWTLSDPNAYLLNNAAYSKPLYNGTSVTLNPKTAQTQDVTLSVIAVDHSDNTKEFAQCAKQVTITKTPVVPKCTDLQILQNNGQPFPALFQYDQNNISTANMTLKVTKDAALNLTYDWNATNGNFENKANKVVKTTPTDPTTFTITDKTKDSNINVYGRFNNDTIMCQDSFTMTGGTVPPPPAQLKCTSLRAAYGNDAQPIPSTLTYAQLSNINNWYLIPNADPALKLIYHWTTDNGKLAPPNPPAVTTFDTTDPTTKLNFTPDDQTKTTTVKASVSLGDPGQNVDPSSTTNCTTQFTINPNPVVQSGKCTTLGFSQIKIVNGVPVTSAPPTQINENVQLVLKANPNPPDYSLIHWVTNGNATLSAYNPADPMCSAYPPTKNAQGNYDFTAPAQCIYQFSGKDGATLHVNPASGNGDTTACQADITVHKTGGGGPGGGGGGYCVNDINPLTVIGNQVCYNVSTTISPIIYVWSMNDGRGSFSTPNKCVPGNIQNVIDVHVYGADTASGGQCQYTNGGTVIIGGGPGRPVGPTLVKSVKSGTNPFSTNTGTSSKVGTIVRYQLEFNTNSTRPVDAIINDTIGDNSGFIKGVTNNNTVSGELSYARNISVISANSRIALPTCTINPRTKQLTSQTPCWGGDISAQKGITLKGVSGAIDIQYDLKLLRTSISSGSCNNQDNPVCSETYTNSARASWQYSNVPSSIFLPNLEQIQSNQSNVYIFCQYFLTRAAGDIFLENPLNGGVDIRKCSKFKSSTGIIVVPSAPTDTHLPSTGQGDDPTTIFNINHEVCTAGQAGTLTGNVAKFYGSSVSPNLSSQICEVKLNPGQNWQRSVITNSIKENKTRISRWSAITGPRALSSLLNSAPKNVYHIKGNLTINQDFTLNNGDGAKTFIVEDGDLIINENITYNDNGCTKDVCTVRDMPSIAFIVLNGNVVVDPSVKEMDGVYFVQGGTNSDGSSNGKGQLISADAPDLGNQLLINGSVFGNIQELFTSRSYSGDPSQDQGGIVIRFDERIILNTPPGLSDVIDLTETQVAR